MATLHFEAGYLAAKAGEFRAAPANLKILTPAHKEWYAGFDAATRNNDNSKLTVGFSLRKGETYLTATI